MRAIIPGRPQPTLHALCTALWEGLRIIAYISGNAIILLDGPQSILQTIYVNDVDSLQSLALEETTGKVAAAGGRKLFIYTPVGRNTGALRWNQQHNIDLGVSESINSLSWASAEEVLTGSDQLLLWNLPQHDEPSIIWKEVLPSPVWLAVFSHDASLIASCGHYDRLVKIWRRLSYEVESTRFDVSYLSHPNAVTDLHWRKPWHAEQNLDNLLYTFCSDDRIRVWAYSEPHVRSIMQLVYEIDMVSSIQPRAFHGSSTGRRRYGFIIDGRDFSSATEKTVQKSPNPDGDHAIEHLLEIARRSPEICVILDDMGHISAWGLENAGHRNKMPVTVFNVIHVQGLQINFKPSHDSLEDRVQFCVFAGGVNDMSFTMLVHYFHGRIDWHDARMAHLFDAAPRQNRSRHVSSWTGHSSPIESIHKSPHGRLLVTCAEDGRGILWKESISTDAPPLQRHGTFVQPERLSDLCYLGNDEVVVLLAESDVTVLDVRTPRTQLLGRAALEVAEKSRYLVPIYHERPSLRSVYLAIVHHDGSAVLWLIRLPETKANSDKFPKGSHSTLRRLCAFENAIPSVVELITAIPPNHINALQKASSQKPLSTSLLTLDTNGLIERLEARLDTEAGEASWRSVTRFETSQNDVEQMDAGPSGFVSLLHSGRRFLSLWDYRSGLLDYEWEFSEDELVQQLKWTADNFSNAFLAVGCPFHVFVFGQVGHSSSPRDDSWTLLSRIRIRDFSTYPLSGLEWLRNGPLVIGCGQQIFVHDVEVALDGGLNQLRQGSRLKTPNVSWALALQNASKAVFHPEYVLEMAKTGLFNALVRLIFKLHRSLKYFSEGDMLSSTLEMNGIQLWDLAHPVSADVSQEEMEELTPEQVEQLKDQLQNVQLEQLGREASGTLINMLGSLELLRELTASVDSFGLRFLFSTSLQRTALGTSQNEVSWREVVFGSHSTSQDILVDQIISYLPDNKLTWTAASRSGLFLWLSDHGALTTQMENLARAEYSKDEDRNPISASLYYLALGKKSVLQGLWRVCIGSREKESTLKLLAQNFEEPRWKQTALKNAYALLSKRRFEYAAAFFLLGGSLKDAVNVCVHQLEKIDLAIAIARVYEGRDDGPVMRSLLENVVLPRATGTGNRWMATWAYQMLRRDEDAIRVLVQPIHLVIPGSKSDIAGTNVGTKEAKHWRHHEPALHVEYLYLRDRSVKQGKWRDVVTPKEEWDFVLRCAREYTRMGCNWLALGLLRNWKFVQESALAMNGKKPTTLNVRETASLQDGDVKEHPDEEKKKPAPTQFEEPSANSLLDAFGF